MFTKQTIKDINLKGKTVLLRAELDAPLSPDGKKVVSDFRLRQNLPTLQALLEADCKIVVLGKNGRPKGVDQTLSLRAVASHLQKIIGHDIEFVDDCVGEAVKKATAGLKPKQIVMLENVRFHAEEDENDPVFAKAMATDSHADVFVQDCFASAHHVGASMVAITKYLPSVAGLSLAKEVETLTHLVEEPERPLMAVIGGAKIDDKLGVMNRFLKIADIIAVGGALANTFLVASGVDVGKSLYDKDEVKLAKEVLKQAVAESKKRPFTFLVPHDVVVAEKVDKVAPTRVVELTTHTMADIQHYPKRVPASASQIQPNEMILDIGPFSSSYIVGAMQLVKTVFWGGTMGVTETASLQGPIGPTAHGTETVIEAILGGFGHRPFSVVGGGDTVGYVQSRKLTDAFNHVSTGGGASLEVLAGHKLPAVEALLDKK